MPGPGDIRGGYAIIPTPAQADLEHFSIRLDQSAPGGEADVIW